MSVNAILIGKQTDSKELSFTLSLAANGWSNGSQTVSDSNLIADGYVYKVGPVATDIESYRNAGIYADNVTTGGSITFYCNKVPSSKIKVQVIREESEIIIPPFDWGDDGSTADAAWFAELQKVVQNGEAEAEWVGLTKSVTLSSAVQGTTTHLIRCIGINQDGNNTITFQTKNCLTTSSAFGSSAIWSNSFARTICQSYYNAFPGKSYIKTVSKGTNTSYNTSSVAYTDETVWLPSIYEVGLSSYQYKPVGAEYTQGCSTPYSYYADNTSRVKYQNDSSSTAKKWWTRSRKVADTGYVCRIEEAGSARFGSSGVTSWIAPAFVIG